MVYGAVTAHRAGTSADRIVFLGHATVLIELDGVRLLTDPLLRARVAHLRRQTPLVDASVTAGLDAVLISHVHHDHLDLASLRLLGRDTPMLVPSGAGTWLRRRRFTQVTELSVGDVARVGALDRHCGRGASRWPPPPPRPASRDPGLPRARAPERSTLPETPSSSRTFPISCSGSTSRCCPSAVGVQRSVRVTWTHSTPHARRELLKPALAIPVHWGTLLPMGLARRHRARLADPPRLFADNVERLAPGVEVRILAPGQETML